MDIVELLCRYLVREQGITENSLPESFERMSGIATKELFTKDIDAENTLNLLDSFVLLGNL